MLKARKGYDKGLKYLVSQNFFDFDQGQNQHFGVPNINYKELLPKDEGYNPNEDPFNRSKKLWNLIKADLLAPQTIQKEKPNITQLLLARNEYQNKIEREEFARANNLPLRTDRSPCEDKYDKAMDLVLTLRAKPLKKKEPKP